MIAAAFGWRAAFVVTGLVGTIVALLVLGTLPEPRARTRVPTISEVFGRESIDAIGYLLRKRTFILVLFGFSSISLLSLGLQQWGPSFLIRSFHVSLRRVGLLYGAVVSGSLLIGALLGGPIAVRARQHGVNWLVRLPALACLLAIPCYAAAFTSHGLLVFTIASVAGGLLLGIATPPIYACIYGIAGRARCAMAVALVFLVFNLLGLGVGPLLIGLLSDALKNLTGEQSLRYSLLIVVSVLLPTSYMFHASGRSVASDFDLGDERHG
jgi:MFS family permease